MNDQNDEAQNYALMAVAGVIALVITIVLMLAVRSGLASNRVAAAGAAGAPVAAVAVSETIVGTADGRVYFELESEALPVDASVVLVRIADLARAQAGKVVLISGFHDASGDAAMNAELAKRRAEAVRHALEANGVTPDRLVLDKPALSTGSGDPKEARRVEMRLR